MRHRFLRVRHRRRQRHLPRRQALRRGVRDLRRGPLRQPGSFVGDRFWLEKLTGSGATATVWRAHDRDLDRPVALKVIEGRREGDLLRFGRETRLLLSLDHPGIVRYVAHGLDTDGAMYLALEWLEGEDLQSRLARSGLTIAESLTIAERIAGALEVVHAKGMVHRDVKPSNVFVVGGDLANIRLLDFGIARMAGPAHVSTGPGSVLGTPGYMAPEQARGAPDTDGRADIFALGSVLFECLTGREAFGGAHLMAVLTKILVEEPPLVSELNPRAGRSLDVLVQRMLAKDPAERPTATELLEYLRELRDAPDTASWTAPPSVRLPALTATEQRLLCVILARGAPREGLDPRAEPTAATLLGGPPNESLAAYRTSVASLGARVEQLADGSVVVILAGRDAREQAMGAARAAIQLRRAMPAAPIALATGRGNTEAPYPVGDAVESAIALLARGLGREAIGIDDVTAGLLDARFTLVGKERGLELWGERPILEAERMLLGRPSPCVGREREIAEIVEEIEACKRGSSPRACVVTAPAGVGKSRLRYEVLRTIWSRGEHACFLLGRGDPATESSPLALIVPALKRLTGIFDSDAPAVRHAKIQARVARYISGPDCGRVTIFLGELLGSELPEEQDPSLRAARQDGQVMGEQIRRAWEDLLVGVTREEPLVLVLEDLQWSDPASLRFVESAMRLLQSRPMFVLALARPEVDERFPALFAGFQVKRMELRELPEEARAKLITEVLGEGIDPALAKRLSRQSGGNAFYLEELMRAAAAGTDDTLPPTVLAMVQTRIEALPAEARRLLRAASVFGQVFWEGGIKALLGGARRTGHVRDLIDELIAGEVITRRDSDRFVGESELSFRHAMVQGAAYAMLTPEDRQLGHRLAAGWLAAVGERDAGLVADHYVQGGEPKSAITWLARAADQAFEQSDFGRAVERAEQAIRFGAEGEVLGGLRARQSHAYYWWGDHHRALECGKEAMERCPAASPSWCRAAAEVAISSTRMGDVETGLAIAGELSRLLHRGERGEAMIIAAARTAEVLYTYSHQEPADRLIWVIESAIEGSTPAPLVIAHVHLARAWAAYYEGRIDVSSGSYDPAAEALESIGDFRGAARTRANQGSDLRELGAFREAESRLRWALAEAERMNLGHVIGACLCNLGLVLGRLGQLDEALDLALRAIAHYERVEDRRLHGGSYSYLALIHLWRGEPGPARAAAMRGCELLDGVILRPHALAVLALAHLAMEEVGDALRAASEAVDLAVEHAPIEEGEGLVFWAYVLALSAAGEHAAARDALADARRRLLGRAARLSDEERRRRFLGDIWEHAQTLAMAEAWLDHERR